MSRMSSRCAGILLVMLAACQGGSSAPGDLTIVSVPPGADLLVDSKPVGKTPYTIETPAAAATRDRNKQLALSHPDRKTWRRSVVLHAHSSQTLTVFLPERGSGDAVGEDFAVEELMLVVKVEEGWMVEVDGRPTTELPSGHGALVAAGTHTLVLRGARGVAHSYRVKVGEPGPAEVQIDEVGEAATGNAAASALEYLGCEGCDKPRRRAPPPADTGTKVDLAINTKPPARVFVDGADSGRTTPLWPSKPLQLAPGVHELGFVTDQGAHFVYKIWIDAEQALNKLIIKQLGGRHSGTVRAEYVGQKR